METIKKQEQELFTKWKAEQGYTYFIPDGVFDEDAWNQQKCKILFVLKEANWENGAEDLCEFLLSEASPTYWKTWNNVARWTKALLEGGEYPYHVSKADKSYWLRKVAFINLKKVGGDAVAEDKVIMEYAKRDAKYLYDQIKLYTPDLVICCGRGTGKNADILHDIVLPQSQVSEWQEPVKEYNYFLYTPDEKKKIPVLSFYHPQIRGSHEILKKRYEEMLSIGGYFKEHYL